VEGKRRGGDLWQPRCCGGDLLAAEHAAAAGSCTLEGKRSGEEGEG